MKKLTIASSAAFLLGSSAAIAQPYGYGPYGNQPYDFYNRFGQHNVCGRNLANTVNYIADPANGMPITQAEYQDRYPWTDTSTWTYDCATNLWTDHTAVQNREVYPQPQYYERDRERRRDRERDRDGERDEDQDR